MCLKYAFVISFLIHRKEVQANIPHHRTCIYIEDQANTPLRNRTSSVSVTSLPSCLYFCFCFFFVVVVVVFVVLLFNFVYYFFLCRYLNENQIEFLPTFPELKKLQDL